MSNNPFAASETNRLLLLFLVNSMRNLIAAYFQAH
jgi:hypothetical protein